MQSKDLKYNTIYIKFTTPFSNAAHLVLLILHAPSLEIPTIDDLLWIARKWNGVELKIQKSKHTVLAGES